MQTYDMNHIPEDFLRILQEHTKEPVIIRNKAGNRYLLLPYSKDNWEEIFLMLYKSFKEIADSQSGEHTKEDTLSADEFIAKWGGSLEEKDIENWKEDYYRHLTDKHR